MKIGNISRNIPATFGSVENNKEKKSLDFGSTLKEQLDKVNDKQVLSDETTNAFIRGEDVDVHEVMLASKEAELSLQLALEVRNKLVKAYQEFNQMQI